MSDVRIARWLALLIPAGLLAGAWGSQLFGGLFPCEMCHWQRWPHYTAVVIALLAFIPGLPKRPLIALAVLAIAVSGVIGVLHAGVEYKWWPGFTGCTSTLVTGADPLDAIMKAPPVRCDQPQWALFGISLAGFNAMISLAGAALTAFFLIRNRAR